MKKNRFIKSVKITLKAILYFILDLSRYISTIIRLIAYYIMLYLGYILYIKRGKFIIGGELFIPIFILFITSIIDRYTSSIGKGKDIPKPNKRFTHKDNDEIYISKDRKEELILYMSDLEDWLERNISH